MRRILVVMAVAALAAAVLAGCRSDSPTVDAGDSPGNGTGATGSTSSSSTPPSSAPASCVAPTSEQATPAVTPRAEMTALRTGHEAGFDRVVFEFDGTTVPGYKVGYIDKPVHEDGSGNEVSVKGKYALEVHMDNASGYHLAGDDSHETYTGPRRVDPVAGTTQIQEVVRTGDFEGVLAWVIGTKDKAGFKVTALSGPPRLLVEVCG